MEVREGMSSVVLTVGPGHTLREAAKRMTDKGVGAAVVIDDEAQGPRVVSERDVLNLASAAARIPTPSGSEIT